MFIETVVNEDFIISLYYQSIPDTTLTIFDNETCITFNCKKFNDHDGELYYTIPFGENFEVVNFIETWFDQCSTLQSDYKYRKVIENGNLTYRMLRYKSPDLLTMLNGNHTHYIISFYEKSNNDE